MKTDLKTMDMNLFFFALLLIVFAVISKVIGCGLGAKVSGMTSHQSLVVGIGMVVNT